MHYTARFEGSDPVDTVRARALDPSAWINARVERCPDGAWIAFERPVVMRVKLDIRPSASGVVLELVEGDLLEITGNLELSSLAGGGTVALVTVNLVFPTQLPSALQRELDNYVFPRWARRLLGPQRPGP